MDAASSAAGSRWPRPSGRPRCLPLAGEINLISRVDFQRCAVALTIFRQLGPNAGKRIQRHVRKATEARTGTAAAIAVDRHTVFRGLVGGSERPVNDRSRSHIAAAFAAWAGSVVH